MRVAICWLGISGYMTSCWRALAAKKGVELRVVAFAPSTLTVQTDAPFDVSLLRDIPHFLLDEQQRHDASAIARVVADHKPDVVVVSGWAHRPYRMLLDHPALRGAKFVMAMDTPFRGDWRQALGRLRLRRYVRRMDRVIVAGERTWRYARYLGVPEVRLRRGCYGFDGELFASTYERRTANGPWPRSFLYAGRYAPEKALDVLLEGYRQYRSSVTDPWQLTCCGTGPERDRVRAAPGVTDLGFVQPRDQSTVFANHGVFVIASRYEPWGVVIAEAAASGLPVICTEACAAGLDVVRTFYNGLTVATDDPQRLACALRWMHDRHDRLPEFGRRSRELAAPFAATEWAVRWEANLRESAEISG